MLDLEALVRSEQARGGLGVRLNEPDQERDLVDCRPASGGVRDSDHGTPTRSDAAAPRNSPRVADAASHFPHSATRTCADPKHTAGAGSPSCVMDD
jgi:hypothetical protein